MAGINNASMQYMPPSGRMATHQTSSPFGAYSAGRVQPMVNPRPRGPDYVSKLAPFIGPDSAMYLETQMNSIHQRESENMNRAWYLDDVFMRILSGKFLFLQDVVFANKYDPEKQTVVYEQTIYTSNIAVNAPPGSIPPILSSRRTGKRWVLSRIAMGFMLDPDFAETERGRQEYAAYMHEMSNTMKQRIELDCISALLDSGRSRTIPEFDFTKLPSTVTAENLINYVGPQIHQCLAVHKGPNAFEACLARAENVIRKARGPEPDTCLLPQGSTGFINATSRKSVGRLSVGPFQPTVIPFQPEQERLDEMAGSYIFQEIPQVNTIDTTDPIDPLSRLKSVLTFVRFPNPPLNTTDWSAGARNIHVWDQPTGFTEKSFVDNLLHSGLFLHCDGADFDIEKAPDNSFRGRKTCFVREGIVTRDYGDGAYQRLQDCAADESSNRENNRKGAMSIAHRITQLIGEHVASATSVLHTKENLDDQHDVVSVAINRARDALLKRLCIDEEQFAALRPTASKNKTNREYLEAFFGFFPACAETIEKFAADDIYIPFDSFTFLWKTLVTGSAVVCRRGEDSCHLYTGPTQNWIGWDSGNGYIYSRTHQYMKAVVVNPDLVLTMRDIVCHGQIDGLVMETIKAPNLKDAKQHDHTRWSVPVAVPAGHKCMRSPIIPFDGKLPQNISEDGALVYPSANFIKALYKESFILGCQSDYLVSDFDACDAGDEVEQASRATVREPLGIVDTFQYWDSREKRLRTFHGQGPLEDFYKEGVTNHLLQGSPCLLERATDVNVRIVA